MNAPLYPGDTDPIEVQIMRLQGFDYDSAFSLFGTLQAKLDQRYGDGLDEDVIHCLGKLKSALEKAEEPEVDPKWDEDMIADDPRRW